MLPSIAKLASKHGIYPLKKLGQNFIFDETLCDKIVNSSCLAKEDIALEIGPGPAGLTRSILKKEPEKLIVIEKDLRCIPLLEEIQKFYPQLIIKNNDALEIKLLDLVANNKLNIISNLPYNIGTPLLISWLHQINLINSMTLMLQKEVVMRIIAKVSTKAYGRLSVICQITCHVEKCFDVSPKAFYPEPKIWSSIIRLTPKQNQISNDLLYNIEKITNIAFSGRRKMIKSSLKTLFPNILDVLEHLQISNNLRAENLSPEHYLSLAKFM